jgi:hypothetical protein
MLSRGPAGIALRRRGLLGSPPPVLAAMVISLDNLLKIFPFRVDRAFEILDLRPFVSRIYGVVLPDPKVA